MLLHVTLEVCMTADSLAALHARYAGLGGPRIIGRGGRWNNDVGCWRRRRCKTRRQFVAMTIGAITSMVRGNQSLTESTLASIKG